MIVHELKTWPTFYKAIESGVKTFELRKDDRGFEIGDALRLREWCPVSETYTGAETTRRIVYIVRNAPAFGLMLGYVILGFR